jgi:ABC-type glycerol-3-phosphate transport system permease component
MVITLVVLVILFPIYWMVATSFKQPLDVLTKVPRFIFTPTLDNYIFAFTQYEFARFIFNSLVVAICSTALVMVTGTLAAYNFARWNIGGGHLLFFILSTRMMPAIAVVIPYFIIFRTLNLLDTHLALIMAYTLICPLLSGFFMGFSGIFRSSLRIRPGLTAIRVLQFFAE